MPRLNRSEPSFFHRTQHTHTHTHTHTHMDNPTPTHSHTFDDDDSQARVVTAEFNKLVRGDPRLDRCVEMTCNVEEEATASKSRHIAVAISAQRKHGA